MSELQELIDAADSRGEPVAFVVNYSGGKDSHMMLADIRKRFPERKCYVVMADTGFEHVKPVTAVDWAIAQVKRFGLELAVVRNPNKTYLQMVERRGMFPSASTRQCTSDLKRGPIEKYIRSLPEKTIINCMGIRAGESSARAKQIPWKRNDGLSVAGRNVWNWFPIFDRTEQEVYQWHASHEEALHPVYRKAGGYLNRFSCRLCIFATGADVAAIREHDREAFDLVSQLEQRIGFTMRDGQTLVQIASAQDAPEPQGLLFC